MQKRLLTAAFYGKMELFKKEPSWVDPVDEEVVDAVKYIVEYNCYTEAQGIVMRCDKLTKYE